MSGSADVLNPHGSVSLLLRQSGEFVGEWDGFLPASSMWLFLNRQSRSDEVAEQILRRARGCREDD